MAGKRTERLQLLLDEEELSALDDWRFEMRMPTRAAAVRQLLRLGLQLDVSRDSMQDTAARVASGDLGIIDSPIDPKKATNNGD